jgi:hypothetical protein
MLLRRRVEGIEMERILRSNMLASFVPEADTKRLLFQVPIVRESSATWTQCPSVQQP